MAYQVDKFNGGFLTSVADGTIDTTTDIRFVGKNYAGYGEVQNENFLHLLENFANTTAPPKKITGQIWFDSSTKKLKFYDGSRFKVASGAEASDSAPSGLSAGDFWWNTAAKQLFAYTGTDFTLVGPVNSPDLGTSIISSAVVFGTAITQVGPHNILKVIADDKVVAIISKAAFTLDTSKNVIEDFSVIKKGITLVKSQTGVSTDDFRFWGTASNSDKLGGFSADQFIQLGTSSFVSEVSFGDPGIQIGDGNDLRIRVENGDNVIVENRLGNDITFRITVTETTDERDVAVVTSTALRPGQNNTYTLGTSADRWNNVFSAEFTGNLTGNVTGNTSGTHNGTVRAEDLTVMIDGSTKQIGFAGCTILGTVIGAVQGNVTGNATNAGQLDGLSASVNLPLTSVATIPVRTASGNITANQFVGTADKADQLAVAGVYRSAVAASAVVNTIAVRDGVGDVFVNVLHGTATAARYADLAEKYLADQTYEVGTVVSIGGIKEITAAVHGDRAIGVVSGKPGLIMNADLEGGTLVALKGRVPVKVQGTIKKGDKLVPAFDMPGAASAADKDSTDYFAIAMQDHESGAGTIEALVL